MVRYRLLSGLLAMFQLYGVPQDLSRATCNNFINNLNEGLDGSLITFATDRKLGWELIF